MEAAMKGIQIDKNLYDTYPEIRLGCAAGTGERGVSGVCRGRNILRRIFFQKDRKI